MQEKGLKTRIRAFCILVFSVLTHTSCSILGVRTAEEVPYRIESKQGDKEIRHYRPRIIAMTTVTGEYKDAQRQAFRTLADYIFGNNIGKQEIAMTAPVTQEQRSVKIAMTAPVTQEKAAEGWTMTFSMPLKYKTLNELPKPMDERIQILERPAGTFAVMSYTWLTNQERNQEKAIELIEWLDREGKYEAISNPFYAGYDPPWTLPFFRRQEMLVEVKQMSLNQSSP